MKDAPIAGPFPPPPPPQILPSPPKSPVEKNQQPFSLPTSSNPTTSHATSPSPPAATSPPSPMPPRAGWAEGQRKPTSPAQGKTYTTVVATPNQGVDHDSLQGGNRARPKETARPADR